MNMTTISHLENAVAVSTFCGLDQHVAANGPTGREVAERALAMPRTDGDDELRKQLADYLGVTPNAKVSERSAAVAESARLPG